MVVTARNGALLDDLPHSQSKFHRRTLGLIFSFLIAVNLLTLALEPTFMRLATYDFQYTSARVAWYDVVPRPDIIFMGASRALNGFDPTIVEEELALTDGVKVRTLNVSINGGSIDLNYLILKNIIRENKKPAVIVYGLGEYDLLDPPPDKTASTLPYFSLLLRPDDFPLYSGQTLETKVDFVTKQLVPLYRDRELIHNALSLHLNPDNPAHILSAPGPYQFKLAENGYFAYPPHRRGPPAAFERARQDYIPVLKTYQWEGYRLARLHDFLELAKARGIKVLLVNLPVTALHRTFWPNQDTLARYLTQVHAVARQHDVPLLDLYKDYDSYFQPDDYYDTPHLNVSGAEVLSRLVTRLYLDELYRPHSPPKDHFRSSFYRASFSQLNVPDRLSPGLTNNGSVLVANMSTSYWPVHGDQSVRLGYHWFDLAGHEVIHEGRRTLIPDPIAPGKAQRVSFTFDSPPQPGTYLLELDLVYDGISWFGIRGNEPLKKVITVTS